MKNKIGLISFFLFLVILVYCYIYTIGPKANPFYNAGTYIIDRDGNVIMYYPLPADRNIFYIIPSSTPKSTTPRPFDSGPGSRPGSPVWPGIG